MPSGVVSSVSPGHTSQWHHPTAWQTGWQFFIGQLAVGPMHRLRNIPGTCQWTQSHRKLEGRDVVVTNPPPMLEVEEGHLAHKVLAQLEKGSHLGSWEGWCWQWWCPAVSSQKFEELHLHVQDLLKVVSHAVSWSGVQEAI